MIIDDVSKLTKISDPEILAHMGSWVDRVDTPHENLGGNKICPYAKAHAHTVIITKLPDTEVTITTTNFTMIVFVAPDELTRDELFNIRHKISANSPNINCFTDYKDENTSMGGHQTNNSKYSLIICQPRDKLASARRQLANTDYYTYYSVEEIEAIEVARNLTDRTPKNKIQNWQEFYNQVRGDSWPECPTSNDVKQLPQWVQNELTAFGYNPQEITYT